VAAALVTGVALALAFPSADLGPVAFVALVPLLLAVETATPRRAGAFGYLAGFTFFGLHLLWIAAFLSWTGPVAWLAWGALSAVEALFVAAFFALVPATRRLGDWRVLLLPACWATLELIRAHVPIGGFPWGLLGTSQHGGGPLLPLARVVGVYGLGAVLIAVNLALARALRALGRGLVTARLPQSAGLARSRRWVAPAVAWPLLAAALACSGLAAPAAPAVSGPAVNLAVVQGNVPGAARSSRADRGATTEQVFANHVRDTEALASAPGPRPQLVVWGEGAVDDDPFANPDRHARITEAARAVGAPLLVGASDDVGSDHLATDALLFGPDGRLLDRYRKRRLVPFGEYVPWGSVIGALIPATREGVPVDKVPGRSLAPMAAPGVPVRFGTLICWESTYAEDARSLARDGAGFLVVITNNASFGVSAGSPQHLAAGQLRAVEEGRTVVQAAVSGPSAVITPDGVAHQTSGLYTETTLRAQVQPRGGLTLYARFGRLLEAALYLLAALTVASAGLLRLREHRARAHGRAVTVPDAEAGLSEARARDRAG
jgi:apolipoprotein N-acyltransferase